MSGALQLEQTVNHNREATKTLLKPDAQLSYALTNSKANGLPSIQIAPLHGQFLSLQVQLMGAKNVLEIGTLGGYSSIWLAKAGAKVTSIDNNPKHREVALENTRGLDIDIMLGAALDVLPKLAAEGREFDLVFLDASWPEQWKYFEWAIKLTRAGGAIYVDNVLMAMIEDGMSNETLIDKVGRDERVSATLVPTVWESKPDGFLLAIVKSK